MISRTRIPLGLAALIAALLTLTACGGSEPGSDSGPAAIVESTAQTNGDGGVEYSGIVRTPSPKVGGLSLPNASDDGKPLTFMAQPGHVLLVFFGYTHCPDVCPTTLADLRAVTRRLPAADRDRVDVAFVTVDPARDTAAVINPYLHSFFPDGSALRTDDAAELKRVADGFSAAYSVEESADGGIDVTHTGFLTAVDPDGRIIVQWPFGTPQAAVEHDLELILAAIGGPIQE